MQNHKVDDMIAFRRAVSGGLGLRLENIASIGLPPLPPEVVDTIRRLVKQLATMATSAVELKPLAEIGLGSLPGVQVMAAAEPAHGTLSVAPDGAVTYTSQRLFIGQDRFRLEIKVGGRTVATAEIDVEVAPHPEIGVPFSDGTFFEDETGFALT
jgi:hypothetical protein